MQNPIQLTERDSELILSVYKYRYLTTSQVARLHFPSLRTAQRRLQRLTTAKYVAPFRVPNINEAIYRITKPGAKHISHLLGVPITELTWKAGSKPPKDYYFMKHFAGISDFRISLTLASRLSIGVDYLGFIPEHYGKKHLSGRVSKYVKDVVFDINQPGVKITHAPDGVFALRTEKPKLFFLEIDRGTETITNPEKGILKMIRFYEGLAEEGKFKGYAQDFDSLPFSSFRLLIATTTEKRIQNMREMLGSHAPKLYKAFWLAPLDSISEENIFSPIWHVLDANDDQLRKIA